MHPKPGILTSPKKWKAKFKSSKINAFSIVCYYRKRPIFWKTLNWLPVKDRFNQSINSTVFKYFTKHCRSYMNEVFELVLSYLKLICPFWKTNTGQSALSFTDSSVRNKTSEVLKEETNSINTFKTNLKRYYLTQLK